ncbi:MAG TPA: isoprenylcysteine carboxylmethyltransferase family protein [Thermoanaerobaculia bacterium]|nr:isoprenylcysteine carboxylmethyltransferase family protein [Thermoanaerobaculia bacterium]
MELSVILYLALLAAVGVSRVIELEVSSNRRRRLVEQGVSQSPEPGFPAMVAFHAGVPVAAALEVLGFHRRFWPALGYPVFGLFLAAVGVRLWAIRSLGRHWNVRVMASSCLGVVSTGPYRFVRHPNYAAVFMEMTSLPLIHTAWVTAVVSAPIHWLLLRRRIAIEDAVLLADPVYREIMSGKPLLLPRARFLFARRQGLAARKA